MKRKDFFKTILGVAAAAVVAPRVFAKEEPEFIRHKIKSRWGKYIDENQDGQWTTLPFQSTTTSTATT